MSNCGFNAGLRHPTGPIVEHDGTTTVDETSKLTLAHFRMYSYYRYIVDRLSDVLSESLLVQTIWIKLACPGIFMDRFFVLNICFGVYW